LTSGVENLDFSSVPNRHASGDVACCFSIYEVVVVVVFAVVHKLQQLVDSFVIGDVDEVLLAHVAQKFLTLLSGS
jgi:hypothetical protein